MCFKIIACGGWQTGVGQFTTMLGGWQLVGEKADPQYAANSNLYFEKFFLTTKDTKRLKGFGCANCDLALSALWRLIFRWLFNCLDLLSPGGMLFHRF